MVSAVTSCWCRNFQVNHPAANAASVMATHSPMTIQSTIGEPFVGCIRYIPIAPKWSGNKTAHAITRTATRTIGSNVSVWVIPTNEELMIARHTLAVTRRR